MLKNLSQKISNFFSNKSPNFFFGWAIFLYCIIFITRLLEPLLEFSLSLLYTNFYSRLISTWLSVFKDFLGTFALLFLIYGLALKIPNIRDFFTSKSIEYIPNKNSQDSVLSEDKDNEILNLYYLQALQQSNINFTVSVIAAVLGFSVIVYTLIADHPRQQNSSTSTSIPSSSPTSTSSLSNQYCSVKENGE
jgi:hypothetical protein